MRGVAVAVAATATATATTDPTTYRMLRWGVAVAVAATCGNALQHAATRCNKL